MRVCVHACACARLRAMTTSLLGFGGGEAERHRVPFCPQGYSRPCLSLVSCLSFFSNHLSLFRCIRPPPPPPPFAPHVVLRETHNSAAPPTARTRVSNTTATLRGASATCRASTLRTPALRRPRRRQEKPCCGPLAARQERGPPRRYCENSTPASLRCTFPARPPRSLSARLPFAPVSPFHSLPPLPI